MRGFIDSILIVDRRVNRYRQDRRKSLVIFKRHNLCVYLLLNSQSKGVLFQYFKAFWAFPNNPKKLMQWNTFEIFRESGFSIHTYDNLASRSLQKGVYKPFFRSWLLDETVSEHFSVNYLSLNYKKLDFVFPFWTSEFSVKEPIVSQNLQKVYFKYFDHTNNSPNTWLFSSD